MCPSTEATDAQHKFATDMLRNLLRHIDKNNDVGRYTFLVSYAWTEGSIMYLVYTAPPSQITWGLVRDTKESIIDPGPWPDVGEAVLYYYLLDLEGIQPSASSRHPGEPDTILWLGDRHAGLPERPSDIPEAYRDTPSIGAPPAKRGRVQDRSVINEPRRYGNPL
jgi:hypothetical protein